MALSGGEAFCHAWRAVPFRGNCEHAGQGEEGQPENEDSEHLERIADLTGLDTPARWCLLIFSVLFWGGCVFFVCVMAVLGFALFGIWGIGGAVFTVLSGVSAYAWFNRSDD